MMIKANGVNTLLTKMIIFIFIIQPKNLQVNENIKMSVFDGLRNGKKTEKGKNEAIIMVSLCICWCGNVCINVCSLFHLSFHLKYIKRRFRCHFSFLSFVLLFQPLHCKAFWIAVGPSFFIFSTFFFGDLMDSGSFFVHKIHVRY